MDSRDLHAVNGALLTLLPKTTATSCLKDCRPISLIHCLGRLVSKVLANRLAPRLVELIHSGQSVFIKGHLIQGNFNLVQSSAKLFHAKKFPCLLLKIDIAQAFDSVASSFLLEVMKHMGFPYRWLNWIAVLLSSATTRVVMNGVPGEPISHGRGLCCVKGTCCPHALPPDHGGARLLNSQGRLLEATSRSWGQFHPLSNILCDRTTSEMRGPSSRIRIG
jgi:hypothetical protein